jgi:hypothetical protein
MKRRFLSLALTLTLALALVLPAGAAGLGYLSGLDEYSGSGDDNNLTYILAILNSATNAKKNVVVSADGTDVPTTQQWTTQAVLDEFNKALDTAHGYYLSWTTLSASQKEEGAAAALVLQNAIQPFKNALRYGTQAAQAVAAARPFSDVAEGDWYDSWVSKVYEKGLFSGYTDGRFGPLDSMTYNQLFAVLYQLSGATETVSDFSYYVQWARDNGLVPAAIGESLSPAAALTRQDLAAIVGLFLDRYLPDYSAVSDGKTFTDQSAIAGYAADGVAACVRAGILTGNTDGSFAPARTANRAQVAVAMVNLAALLGR